MCCHGSLSCCNSVKSCRVNTNLQLSKLGPQRDEANVQLATKVVGKTTVVVVDTKEC